MEGQGLTLSRELLPIEIVDDAKAKKTYLMLGKPEEKALDIYHLILVPTHACNLRCTHCYLPDHDNDLFPKDSALKLVDEWSEMVLEERGQYGGIFHIKGGEPFLIPYLWDITNRLVELQSLRLMITTNGTFTEEDIFKRLRDCSNTLRGYVTIIVSLDGATEKTHAILRGNGQFKKTLEFLEGLRKYGVTFYLNCVMHKKNTDELLKYMGLAKEYGAAQVNFLSFVPRGTGSGFRQFQIPHLDVYRQLNRIYESANEELKNILTGSLPHIKCRETSGLCRTSQECVAAYRGMFYVTPDGYVYACPNTVFQKFAAGNIFGQNLREISDGLSNLYKRLKNYNQPYICTGEKILYERNNDKSNIESLDKLQHTILNEGKKILENLTYGPLNSYCFSRNW